MARFGPSHRDHPAVVQFIGVFAAFREFSEFMDRNQIWGGLPLVGPVGFEPTTDGL